MKIMETKGLLRDMCWILFRSENKIVCTKKESDKYLCITANKTLNAFFNDEKRKAPTKKICGYVLELCSYYLYPEKYRNNMEYRNNDSIIRFSCKVIFFLNAVCKHNYSMFRINDDYGKIDDTKRKALYQILEALLRSMEKHEFLDTEQFQKELDRELLFCSRNLEEVQTREPKTYYTKEEIKKYLSIAAESFEKIEKNNGQRLQKLKQGAEDYFSLVNQYISFAELCCECSFIYQLKDAYKKYREDNFWDNEQSSYTFDREGNVDEQRTAVLNFVLDKAGLSHSAINYSYIDYVNSTQSYTKAYMDLKVLRDRLDSIYQNFEWKIKDGQIKEFTWYFGLSESICKMMDYLMFQQRLLMNFSID